MSDKEIRGLTSVGIIVDEQSFLDDKISPTLSFKDNVIIGEVGENTDLTLNYNNYNNNLLPLLPLKMYLLQAL